MSRVLVLLAVLGLLAIGGCGSDDSDDESTGPAEQPAETKTTETPSPDGETPAAGGKYGDSQSGGSAGSNEPAAEAPGTEIKLDESQFGEILFDGAGQAIYLFDLEESATSECYDDCAAAWPPVLTDGDPVAGEGIDESLLGTTERDDGSTQVTYNDHPLYYYAHEDPGQVLCHDIAEFGGTWLVLDGAGNALPGT